MNVWLVLRPLTFLFDDVFILILVGRHTLGVLIVISCQFGSKTTTKGLPGEFFFVFPLRINLSTALKNTVDAVSNELEVASLFSLSPGGELV